MPSISPPSPALATASNRPRLRPTCLYRPPRRRTRPVPHTKQVANRTWTRSPLRDAVAARACGRRALPPPVPRLRPHRPPPHSRDHPLQLPPHSRAGHQLRRPKRRRVGRFDQPGEAEAAGRTPTLDARPAAPHPGRRLLRPLAAGDHQHRRIAPPPPDAPCAGRRLGHCQAFALRALKRLHRPPLTL
jgi:hypothetical protein